MGIEREWSGLGAAAIRIPRVIVILVALDVTLAQAALTSYAPMLSAVRMALVLQAVLIAVPLAQQAWGATGVLAPAQIPSASVSHRACSCSAPRLFWPIAWPELHIEKTG